MADALTPECSSARVHPVAAAALRSGLGRVREALCAAVLALDFALLGLGASTSGLDWMDRAATAAAPVINTHQQNFASLPEGEVG